jgi:hypothetical protein
VEHRFAWEESAAFIPTENIQTVRQKNHSLALNIKEVERECQAGLKPRFEARRDREFQGGEGRDGISEHKDWNVHLRVDSIRLAPRLCAIGLSTADDIII